MAQEQMSDIELSSQPGVHIATQQEKLDAIFGITNGQDLDSYLDSLTLDGSRDQQSRDDALSGISQLSALDQTMKDKMAAIESTPLPSLSLPAQDVQIQMASMEHSLQELEEMVSLSKDIIKHVHQSILATPLIDSEAVQAYSKLVESIHISISEFIGVYRDKQNFINKVKYALFDQQQKKDLLRYKADLQIEVMKAKDGPRSVDAQSIESSQAWSQEQVTKILNDNAALEVEQGN